MIDRTGAARTEWRHWDRFTEVIYKLNYQKMKNYLNLNLENLENI